MRAGSEKVKIGHIVLITGITEDRKNFKIKDSEKKIKQIPISRLTYYQSKVLKQNDTYFNTKKKGINVPEDELKTRLLSALRKTSKSSQKIDFDKNSKYMMLDTGYCLRFKKLNDHTQDTDDTDNLDDKSIESESDSETE